MLGSLSLGTSSIRRSRKLAEKVSTWLGMPIRCLSSGGARTKEPMSVYLNHFLAWVPLVALGIVNAAIRRALYARYVSEPAAHQISTLTICVLWGSTLKGCLAS